MVSIVASIVLVMVGCGVKKRAHTGDVSKMDYKFGENTISIKDKLASPFPGENDDFDVKNIDISRHDSWWCQQCPITEISDIIFYYKGKKLHANDIAWLREWVSFYKNKYILAECCYVASPTRIDVYSRQHINDSSAIDTKNKYDKDYHFLISDPTNNSNKKFEYTIEGELVRIITGMRPSDLPQGYQLEATPVYYSEVCIGPI